MKKISLLTLFLTIFSFGMVQAQEPNRVIVHTTMGGVKGFLTDRVDSIDFATISGPVAAKVTFKEYRTGAEDTVKLSVTKSPDCFVFRIACMPTVRANALVDDATVERYFDQVGGTYYSDNFVNADMTGFDFIFEPGADYTILTLGYDKYGIGCQASRASFTTPSAPVVGSPSVSWTATEVLPTSFTLSMTANADCAGFYTCMFKKGEAEAQFNQWGPMMGFSSMADMIKSWSGQEYTGTKVQQWEALVPGTEYEVYILPVDVNQNYADMVIANVTTAKMGGEGTAEVTITASDFGGNSGTGYYQEVIYTPNDQASLHRDMLIEKSTYNTAEWGDEGVLNYLKADNEYDTYWNQYDIDIARWTVSPSTDYIAFSVAKNINDEWGPLARLDISTPAASAKVPYRLPAVAPRLNTAAKGGVSPLSMFTKAKRELKIK